MRGLVAVAVALVVLGLIPTEAAALVLAALALVVAGLAYTAAMRVQRAFRHEMAKQSTAVDQLVATANGVEAQIRDDGG